MIYTKKKVDTRSEGQTILLLQYFQIITGIACVRDGSGSLLKVKEKMYRLFEATLEALK